MLTCSALEAVCADCSLASCEPLRGYSFNCKELMSICMERSEPAGCSARLAHSLAGLAGPACRKVWDVSCRVRGAVVRWCGLLKSTHALLC